MPSLWSILTALSPIIAPIVSLVLIVAGRILWNHEQRIRDLESAGKRRSRTLYGDENDDRQIGLSEDLQNIDNRLTKLEEQLESIEGHLSDINGYNKDRIEHE